MTATFSVIAALLLMIGFGYGIRKLMFPTPSIVRAESTSAAPLAERAPSTQEDRDRIVAIGDSLAKGTGDLTGQGFARRSATLLGQGGERDVQFLNNLGINGMTTTELLEELKQPGVRYVLKEANLILLSIGANDLFQGGGALQTSGGSPNPDTWNKVLPKAANRLGQVLDELRAINPSARIVYIGLYNPFGDVPSLRQEANQGVTTWNTNIAERLLTDDQVFFTPTFDLFQRDPVAYLSSDHFHPNSAGYERIAERIVQALR